MLAAVDISARRREPGLFQETSTVESIVRMKGRNFGDCSVKLLTVKQAAEYLGFPLSTMYRLVKQKKIDHLRPTPRTTRIARAALDAFVRRNTVRATAPDDLQLD